MPANHYPNIVDCGVFAVASATDCIFNIEPETATYNGCNANSPEGIFNTKKV